MPWTLIGMIGAPAALALGVALGWVWITDSFTISSLQREVSTVTARRDRLETAIFGPAGWKVRLSTAESNVNGLRGAIDERNAEIDRLERERQERNRARDAELARLAAERDRAEERYTIILNQPPQADIAQQALDIVFEAIQ
jgi:hypothetical protein